MTCKEMQDRMILIRKKEEHRLDYLVNRYMERAMKSSYLKGSWQWNYEHIVTRSYARNHLRDAIKIRNEIRERRKA